MGTIYHSLCKHAKLEHSSIKSGGQDDLDPGRGSRVLGGRRRNSTLDGIQRGTILVDTLSWNSSILQRCWIFVIVSCSCIKICSSIGHVGSIQQIQQGPRLSFYATLYK